tara:strand:- start:1869 stop:2084 length:216 start_codon:yes stop_codon:yes gene_type:complete
MLATGHPRRASIQADHNIGIVHLPSSYFSLSIKKIIRYVRNYLDFVDRLTKLDIYDATERAKSLTGKTGEL